MKNYPIEIKDDVKNHSDVLECIARIRFEDIRDFNNLANVYMAGRRVSFVPANAADTSTSRAGDFNITDSFAYFCVESGGAAVWRRVALQSW